MPNIKIDVEAMRKRIRQEMDGAIERIQNLTKELVAEVDMSARAGKDLPAVASDLVATAEICLVAEIDTVMFRAHEKRLQVSIDIGGGSVTMASYDRERQPLVPDGRYRAVFVLLPIEKR